jgi:alkanesulfonate monooxygenase
MSAEGLDNESAALGDKMPRVMRYVRLIEYVLIVKSLLVSSQPLVYNGKFYRIEQLTPSSGLPEKLAPGIFMSCSSASGMAVARTLGATVVKYPGTPDAVGATLGPEDLDCGLRIGIIARKNREEAREIADARFPKGRCSRIMRERAASTPYQLALFRNSKNACPYLVGSYDEVARELSAYATAGYRAFLLEAPATEDELDHARAVLERASWDNGCR